MMQTLATELQTNSQHLLDVSMNLPINLNTNNEQQTNGETTPEVSVQDVESDSDDEITKPSSGEHHSSGDLSDGVRFVYSLIEEHLC